MARILIIDDDQAVRLTVKLLLDRQGHEAMIAESARHGLKLLESQSFDLLIVDIFMPDIDGLETINRIRQGQKHIPIIAISGHSFRSALNSPPDFLAMAIRLGAVRSLQKPFSPRDLAVAIDDILKVPATASQAHRSGRSGSGT